MARSDAMARRQEQRAQEALTAALARGDLDRALTAFFALPSESRQPQILEVARLLSAGASAARRSRNWARLCFIGARCEREPALLSCLTGAEQSEARWALLWGAVKSHEWRRARLQLEALRGTIQEPAPALWRWLDDLLRSEGRATQPLVGAEAVIAVQRAGRERLGYTDVSPRRAASVPPSAAPPSAVSPPTTPQEVASRLLACRAQHPWPRFAESIATWVKAASPDVANATRIVAATLAVREQVLVLAQRQKGSDRAPAWHPLRSAARWIIDAGAPPELEEEAWLAFRLVLSACPMEGLSSLDTAEALTHCASAAARYAGLRGHVAECVSAVPVTAPTHPALLPFLEAQCQDNVLVPFWEKALRCFGMAETRRATPTWLERALNKLLQDRAPLARWLLALDPGRLSQDLFAATNVFSLAHAEALLDALWADANPDQRALLADALYQLLERAQGRPTRHAPAGPLSAEKEAVLIEALQEMLGGKMPERELRKLLHETPMGRQMLNELAHDHMPDPVPTPSKMRAPARQLWGRFRERASSVDVRFLDLALQDALSTQTIDTLLDRFLTATRHLDAQLIALSEAEASGCQCARDGLLDRIIKRHLDDVEALAQALTQSLGDDFLYGAVQPFARALCEAEERTPGAARSPAALAALAEAYRLLPKRRRRGAKRGTKTKAKRAAKAESAEPLPTKTRNGGRPPKTSTSAPSKPARADQRELFEAPDAPRRPSK